MDEATATDNCGGGYHCREVTTAGACAGDYVITRTFTATDDCGNASTLLRLYYHRHYVQSLTSVAADYTAECSDEHPMDEATATDNCGEVVITVEEVTTAGACDGDYVITRTFTATDAVVTQQALLRLLLSSTLAPSLLSQLITQLSVLTNTQWMKLLLLTTVEKWLSL